MKPRSAGQSDKELQAFLFYWDRIEMSQDLYNQAGLAYQQALLAGADPVQHAEMLFFHLGGSGLSARVAASWVVRIIFQIKGQEAGLPLTVAFAARPNVDAALQAEVAAHHAAVEAEKASMMRPEREPEGVRLAREAGLAAAGGGNGGARPKRGVVLKAAQEREQLRAEAAAAKDARAARAIVAKARRAQAEAIGAAQAAQAAAAAASPQQMAEAHAAAVDAVAVAEEAGAQADELSQGLMI